MSNLKFGLQLELQGDKVVVRGLENVRGEVRSVTSELDNNNDASIRAGRSTRKMGEDLGVAGALARGFAGAIASIGVAGFVKELYSVNAESQKLKASLETVTGSQEAAAIAWEKLEKFASSTPFALEQSVGAFIKMKSLGLDPTESALTSFGNTASAMGKDLNQMIEAVADASTGEFERLKEFGIKANQEGDKVKLTFQGVTSEIGNNSAEIVQYLENIGNQEFAGAMERQMDTLGGAMSNLQDNVAGLLRAIGDSGSNAGLASAINGLSAAVVNLKNELGTEEFQNWLTEAGIFLQKYQLVVNELTKSGEEASLLEKAFAHTPAGMLYRYLGFGGKDEFESSVDAIKKGFAEIDQEAQMFANGRILEDADKPWADLIERMGEELDQLGKAHEAATEQSKEQRTAIENLIDGLEKQKVGLGDNKRAMLEYELTSNQATDAETAKALALFDAVAAYAKAELAVESYLEQEKNHAKAVNQTVSEVDISINQLQREVAALIAGEAATKAFNREKFIENALRSENSRKLLPEEIAKYRELLGQQYDLQEQVERLKDAADPLAESWQEALNRIDSAFVELWKSAFDGFDDFSDALKDAFIQLLAELAHRATTQQILIALGLDYGQGTSSSGGAGSGNSGNLLSLAGMLKGGLAGIGKAGMGLFELLGASNYAATTASAGQSIAGWFGADDLSLNANVGVGMIANAVAGAAGAWAGGKLAEELFGKNAESAYGATAGAVIGSLWGPLGSAIGGAIGGAIDVITGGDGKTRSALGVATNADWTAAPEYQAQGASGLLYTAYQKRVGDQGADIAQQMMQVFVATDYALTSLLESLGATVDLAGNALPGKSSQEGEAGSGFFGATGYNGAITEADLRGAADQFVREFVDAVNEASGTAFDLEPIFDLQLENEMLGDTLLRVQAEAAGVNQIFTALGYSTYELSVAGMVAADNLVQAAGGLQNLASLTDYYYQNVYSEQERAQMLADQYTQVLDNFNATFGTAITSTADLRAYVDALAASESWASDETQAAYLAALQLTPALVGLSSALETIGSTVVDVVDDVLSAGQLSTIKDIASTIFGNFTDRQETVADLQDRLSDIDAEIADIATGLQDGLDPLPDVIGGITDSVDTLTRSSSELRSQADSIFNTIASLSLGQSTHLTNREQLDFARSQYEEAQRLYRTTGDASQLSGAAQAYQQEIVQYFAGNDTGRTLSDNIIQYLGTVGVSLDTQADASERAEQVAEAQRVALESISVTQATALDTAQENARLDQLYQERQLIEQQLANLTAVDSQAILEGQLSHLVDITGGIDTLNELLGVLPMDIADALAQQLGIAIAEYRALTDVEQFFAGLADAGIASFDTGTPFVTRDQTANIHRGEIIIDPASSAVLRRYGINVQGGGNAEVVARLDAILTRLESLEGTTGTGFVRSEQQRERHISATENVPTETARQLKPVEV